MRQERISKLLDNTYYAGVNGSLGIDKLASIVPAKIKKRLRINQAGLNNLATVILEPAEGDYLREEDLAKLSNQANTINQLYGFGDTSDLIIRTARERFCRVGQKQIPTGSEPALLVMNTRGEKPRYKILSGLGGMEPIGGLADFIYQARSRAFFLIHDDNDKTQKEAMHGRFGKYFGSFELMCGLDILHPRGLGNPDSKHPAIRINHHDPTFLMEIDPRRAYLKPNNKAVVDGIEIHRINADDKQTKKMLSRIRDDGELIWEAYRKVREIFGEAAIMEFRLYTKAANETKYRMQVMDVDYRF